MKSSNLFALLLTSVLLPMPAMASDLTCEQVFASAERVQSAQEAHVLAVLDAAIERSHGREPQQALVHTSMMSILSEMGVDGLVLFGLDKSSWPLYLGKASDGRMIFAASATNQITIYSYTKLDSVASYDKRALSQIELDIDRQAPAGHEKFIPWLIRKSGREKVRAAFESYQAQFPEFLLTGVGADFLSNEWNLVYNVRHTSTYGQPMLANAWFVVGFNVLEPKKDLWAGAYWHVESAAKLEPLVANLLK